jgi:predicted transglutaminase-like cysteine proteinase
VPCEYTKDELLAYLRIGREKARAAVAAMTDERARRASAIPWLTLSEGEVILDNLRHVQHHAAQLNLILRQVTDSAPRWVATVRTDG